MDLAKFIQQLLHAGFVPIMMARFPFGRAFASLMPLWAMAATVGGGSGGLNDVITITRHNFAAYERVPLVRCQVLDQKCFCAFVFALLRS